MLFRSKNIQVKKDIKICNNNIEEEIYNDDEDEIKIGNIFDFYVSYKDIQKKQRENIVEFNNKQIFDEYLPEEKLAYNIIKKDIDINKLKHTEGSALKKGYSSLIVNENKLIPINHCFDEILFDLENNEMVNERKKLNKVINLVNNNKEHKNNDFKLTEFEVKLLDEINIYFLCDIDLKKYLKLKLKDETFTSQNVIILNEDLHFTIVNNVYTYYLCKENTFDENGKNEPYDLPISYIHQILEKYGLTKDYQRSKVVLRMKPPWRSSILVFRSGINVSTGSPNEKMADFLTKLFVRQLRFQCKFDDIDIGMKACQNKVAAAKIKFGVCLNLLSKTYSKPIVDYNPENFAGVIVKLPNEDDKITLLVFNTRKIICVGAKNEENLISAYLKLYKMLLLCSKTTENLLIENQLIEEKKLNEINEKLLLNNNDQNNNNNLSLRGRGRGSRGNRGRTRGRARGSTKGRIISTNLNDKNNIISVIKKPRGRPRKIKQQ